MKKAKASFVALLLVFAMLVPSVSVFAQPAREDLVPIRAFFEDIGGEVHWDNDTRSILIGIDGGTIVLFPGQPAGYVNHVPVTLAYGALLIQNVAFLAEADLETLLIAFLETLPEPDLMTLTLTEEARDIALADFDYMVAFTLENSVWDNVIYRRTGIDFAQHVADHRAHIENMLPISVPYLPGIVPFHDCDEPRSIAANYLINLLFFSFSAPLEGIGHLAPRDLILYRMLLTVSQRVYHSPEGTAASRANTQAVFGAYTAPATVWFYGEYEVDLQGEDGGFPNVPGNIITEILVPGEVAYMGIQSFLASWEYDSQTIFPFLREVQDFDHLILDIRGNGGGHIGHFTMSTFLPLVTGDDIIEIPSYQFFTSGDAATEVFDTFVQVLDGLDAGDALHVEVLPASEFANQRNLNQFAPEDLARLSYVLVAREMFSPSDLETERIPFYGHIWLLVDEWTASASVGAAVLAANTGFATIVGENTSGVMQSQHVYVSLPTTGIVWRVDVGHLVDRYGRSLEEFGLIPDIFSLPGMDALETVLALIAECEY